MDAFKKMSDASRMMQEAFDDLQDVMEDRVEELEDKIGSMQELIQKLLMREKSDFDKMRAMPGNDDVDAEDFMDRRHFKKSLINGDDESFYEGVSMEIRIPNVIQAQRQDMYVPVSRALIKGEE